MVQFVPVHLQPNHCDTNTISQTHAPANHRQFFVSLSASANCSSAAVQGCPNLSCKNNVAPNKVAAPPFAHRGEPISNQKCQR